MFLVIFVSLFEGILGDQIPVWTIRDVEPFENSSTNFECLITNINCDPFPDNAYLQKYVDGWKDAACVYTYNNYTTEELSDGSDLDGRIVVDYRDDIFGKQYRIVINGVMLLDGGKWRCSIKECDSKQLDSEDQSFNVITQIADADVLIKQPEHILLGSPVDYTCTSERVNPVFDVEWSLQGMTYTNGTPNNEDKGLYYKIQNDNEFTFCENRDTTVSCILNKTIGKSWSAETQVTQTNIVAPAKIAVFNISTENPVISSDLTMYCTASGTRRNVAIKKDGNDLPNGLFNTLTENTTGMYHCGETEGNKTTLNWIQHDNLTCEDVTKHDGSYRCEVTGDLGSSDVSDEYSITAQYSPIIIGKKETVIDAMVGTEVKMTCATDCARPDVLTYSWTSDHDREGLDKDSEEISIVVTDQDFNVTFTCTVNNTVGSIKRTFILNDTDVTEGTTQAETTSEPPTTENIIDESPNQALVTAFAVIWSLCGVFAILLVCLALYHYRQIQNGKEYKGEYSEELVLTEDEAQPGTSHGSGVYDDISPAVVGKGSVSGESGSVPNEGLYAEVQRPAQTQIPVAPTRTSKIQASHPNPGTPKTKRTQTPAAPKSPMNARHQPNSPSSDRRPEPKADYSPVSNKKVMPPKHSQDSNHVTVSKVVQNKNRHEAPTQPAPVKQNTNGTKPSVPVKPDIQSFRSSRSSGIIPAGAPYYNAEVNLYANCDQRPEPKNGDDTITYADLSLQKEDPYDEGAPPVPKKNITDQEPVQYASIKHNK